MRLCAIYFVMLWNQFTSDMCFFFFFKQKTAYEMRISDWSSDVCSSDLVQLDDDGDVPSADMPLARSLPLTLGADGTAATNVIVDQPISEPMLMAEIGRASCRERVCQYV